MEFDEFDIFCLVLFLPLAISVLIFIFSCKGFSWKEIGKCLSYRIDKELLEKHGYKRMNRIRISFTVGWLLICFAPLILRIFAVHYYVPMLIQEINLKYK